MFPDQAAVESALEAGKLLYVTSAWGLTIGQTVQSSIELPSCEPFALRLIALPSDYGTHKAEDTQDNKADVFIPGTSIQEAEVLPPVSSFSPERNVVERLNLIQANGTVKETLACFQMLAQVMNSFRRDSIEKVLEDNLGRGLTPNLQFSGQLAVSLGLHVMGSQVPATAGTRLQVP